MNGLYTAASIKQGNSEAQIAGRWIPARPLSYWCFRRFSLAWGVLTMRYDALDWEHPR